MKRKEAAGPGFSRFLFPSSNPHRDRRSPLQFSPPDPGAFEGAKDCLPDHVTEERPVDQPHREDAPCVPDGIAFQDAGEGGQDHIHREENDDEGEDRPPGAEGKRSEEEKIDQRRDRDEQNWEEPNARQAKPAERAIAPVENFLAMFPKALQGAVGPAMAGRKFVRVDGGRHLPRI